MSNRIQRAMMIGLLMLASVGSGACLTPLGKPCGDSWCPDGFLCSPFDVCITSGCGNGFLELDEACDDGNLDDGDSCLSTCQSSMCGDGAVNPQVEACDDGNLDDEDSCLSTCQLNTCGDSTVNPRVEACDDGNSNNDDGCRDDCTVSLPAYVKASNAGRSDGFGYSVALSADGSTLAIGTLGEASAATGVGGDQADNSAGDSGAVYVFKRSGTTWSQQAYIKASNTEAGDKFGYSVALSADGSVLAVGAFQEASAATGIGGDQADNNAWASGAVYVFTRSGATWSQQAYVKASNPDAGDRFGYSVVLSADGSTLAVGAIVEASAEPGIGGNQADNSALGAGAVYVFTRSGATWSQQAYIKASNPGGFDYFGTSVALSADGLILAVGAYQEASAAVGIGGDQADNSAPAAGAVYVFTRSGATWSQQAYIKASNPGAGDRFGTSVALSADGSTLAVGADGEASLSTGVGGDGADNSAGDSGAVYVFTRNDTAWSQQAYVKTSNTGGGDRFGSSVALSADGSTLAIGADGEDSAATGIGGNQADNVAVESGAVYVFARGGTTWSQQAYVKASNTGAVDHFGTSVALSANGSILAVGADLEDSAATGIGGDQADQDAEDSGAVYVYPLPVQQSLRTNASLSEPDAPASAASVPGGWLGP